MAIGRMIGGGIFSVLLFIPSPEAMRTELDAWPGRNLVR
jgi:hypothetical protein